MRIACNETLLVQVQFWSKPAPEGKYTRSMFVDITERVLLEQEKARLEAQNIYLQEEIRSEHNLDEIVGNSPSLLEVPRQAEQIAKTDCTVLILGETRTGKELIARSCAAIPSLSMFRFHGERTGL
jgi:formate hydrogenlyase transcriptional activator